MKKPEEKDNIISFKPSDRAAIIAAMDEAEKRRNEDGLALSGRKYLSVKDRVDVFRRFFGHSLSIITDVNCPDPSVSKGSPVKAVCHIRDVATGNILATGTALEYVGSSEYTRTSPFEVAETSAIGRALASLGLHGGEFASANEIVVARAPLAIDSISTDLTNNSMPSIGDLGITLLLPSDMGEMINHVKEALDMINDMSALQAAFESVEKQFEKIGPPQEIKREVNDLFKSRFSYLRSRQHKEQQEKVDG